MPVNEQSLAGFARMLGIDMEAHQQMMMDQLAGRWVDGETQFVRDESVPRDRIYFAQTPLNPNSIASRIVNDADRLTWGDLYGGLRNGEPLTPATCHTCGVHGPCAPRPCGARECHSQVCVDLCVECVGGSRRQLIPGIDYGTATGAMMGEEYRLAAEAEVQRRLEYRAYGDGDGSGPVLESASRPDHYRVRPGQCACGFRTPFRADILAHLDGPTANRWWTVCECGESRLCRRVVTYTPQPHSWTSAEFDPTRAPTFTEIYLCDDCCARRGIGR